MDLPSCNRLLAWEKKGLCFVMNVDVHTKANSGLLFSQSSSSNKLLSSVSDSSSAKKLYHKHIYTSWMRVIDACKKSFREYKNERHLWKKYLALALDLQSMTGGKKSFQSQNKFNQRLNEKWIARWVNYLERKMNFN